MKLNKLKSITVEFQNGDISLYNVGNIGARNIETMKQLALAGRGLSRFISQVIGGKYSAKLS